MNATTTKIHGQDAVQFAERTGATLFKYADPIEGEREGLSVAEARDIAFEDHRLIYCEVSRIVVDGVRVDLADASEVDRATALVRASNDEGVLPATAMVPLFPGEPTRHTETMLRTALGWIGAVLDDH